MPAVTREHVHIFAAIPINEAPQGGVRCTLEGCNFQVTFKKPTTAELRRAYRWAVLRGFEDK